MLLDESQQKMANFLGFTVCFCRILRFAQTGLEPTEQRISIKTGAGRERFRGGLNIFHHLPPEEKGVAIHYLILSISIRCTLT